MKTAQSGIRYADDTASLLVKIGIRWNGKEAADFPEAFEASYIGRRLNYRTPPKIDPRLGYQDIIEGFPADGTLFYTASKRCYCYRAGPEDEAWMQRHDRCLLQSLVDSRDPSDHEHFESLMKALKRQHRKSEHHQQLIHDFDPYTRTFQSALGPFHEPEERSCPSSAVPTEPPHLRSLRERIDSIQALVFQSPFIKELSELKVRASQLQQQQTANQVLMDRLKEDIHRTTLRLSELTRDRPAHLKTMDALENRMRRLSSAITDHQRTTSTKLNAICAQVERLSTKKRRHDETLRHKSSEDTKRPG